MEPTRLVEFHRLKTPLWLIDGRPHSSDLVCVFAPPCLCCSKFCLIICLILCFSFLNLHWKLFKQDTEKVLPQTRPQHHEKLSSAFSRLPAQQLTRRPQQLKRASRRPQGCQEARGGMLLIFYILQFEAVFASLYQCLQSAQKWSLYLRKLWWTTNSYFVKIELHYTKSVNWTTLQKICLIH